MNWQLKIANRAQKALAKKASVRDQRLALDAMRTDPFSDGVREYVARHAPEDVTDAMDRACAKLENPKDDFVSLAAHRILERSEW
jgi:hypothetical protein